MEVEATRPARGPGPRSRAAELMLFAGNFLRDPYMLGSLIPSSRFLVDAVLDRVDWSRARCIVELGPGIGTFTGEILQRMRPDARLLVIETNLEFVQFIAASVPDHRLRVEHGSASEVQRLLKKASLGHPDYIISGIPLGSMPRGQQVEICAASRAVLADHGEFLVYQFTARVLPVLRELFPAVRRMREWRNIPPAQLFACSGA